MPRQLKPMMKPLVLSLISWDNKKKDMKILQKTAAYILIFVNFIFQADVPVSSRAMGHRPSQPLPLNLFRAEKIFLDLR